MTLRFVASTHIHETSRRQNSERTQRRACTVCARTHISASRRMHNIFLFSFVIQFCSCFCCYFRYFFFVCLLFFCLCCTCLFVVVVFFANVCMCCFCISFFYALPFFCFFFCIDYFLYCYPFSFFFFPFLCRFCSMLKLTNTFSCVEVDTLKTICSVVFLLVQMIEMPALKTFSKKFASPMHRYRVTACFI